MQLENKIAFALFFKVTLFNHSEFPNNIGEGSKKLGHRLKSLTLGGT